MGLVVFWAFPFGSLPYRLTFRTVLPYSILAQATDSALRILQSAKAGGGEELKNENGRILNSGLLPI